MGLKKFSGDEIVLNNQEAWEALCFFFGGNAWTVPQWLTDNDRSFAQALLVEAIDASYAMSWVEEIFRATANPSKSLRSILLRLGAKAARDWFSHASRKDLKKPKIYVAVRDTLRLNWKTAWAIRVDTGDPVY